MEDKTFTQEEVNAIVQERLAKEKAKHEKQIEDITAGITTREKKLEAREKLEKKGLPPELVDLVKLDSDESFNTSLELLEKTYKQGSQASVGGKGNVQAYTPQGSSGAMPDPIRAAMGLKR